MYDHLIQKKKKNLILIITYLNCYSERHRHMYARPLPQNMPSLSFEAQWKPIGIIFQHTTLHLIHF